MPDLMQSHDYMKDFSQSHFPYAVRDSKGSDRAVYLTMLLLSRPDDGSLVVDYSTDHLMWFSGTSHRTCERALAHLKDANLIYRDEAGRWVLA